MNLGVWLVAEKMRWSFLNDNAQDVQIKTATSLAFVSLLNNCHWHTDCLIYSHALIVVCLLGAQVVLLIICNITHQKLHIYKSTFCVRLQGHMISNQEMLEGKKKCTCTENTEHSKSVMKIINAPDIHSCPDKQSSTESKCF